jgi:hypothetical protein
MMHVPTCDALKQEFMAKYTKDFQITGGGLMETFLGMQVEQSQGKIRLHLDNYIRETLDEYKEFSTKSLRPKQVPIQPGLILEKTDCPIVPDPRKQKFYRSLLLNFNSLQHGFVLTFHLQ